jgi:pimeloyl-ACP methyl ester carboxylesterase
MTDIDRPPLLLLHGLTYDRHQWDPFIRVLAETDPDRRVLAVDLPGHGDAPRWDSYNAVEVVDALHDAVTRAGLGTPVVVGHSLGGVLAGIYAARHPARAVVDVDQPLLVGGFGDFLRQSEPILAGPQWRAIWDRLLGGMGIAELPPEARELVRTRTDPRPELLLGYWDPILRSTNDEINGQRESELRTISNHKIAYAFVTSTEPDPAYKKWLLGLVPAARIEVLPGGGHFPHLAHPAELAAIVTGLDL